MSAVCTQMYNHSTISTAAVLITAFGHHRVHHVLHCTVLMYTKQCGSCGEWQRGVSLLGEMRRARVRPTQRSYGNAIAGCAKAGQWHACLCLIEEMQVKYDINVKQQLIVKNTPS
jgi:pentatricopeptide repeat protein